MSEEARPRILSVGEALVDVVRLAEVPGAGAARPGGSPMNVAVGLGRLGHDVQLLTSLADDEYGRLITEHLEASGVTVDAGAPVSGRTSSAIATILADGSASYDFDVDWILPDGPRVDAASVRIVHTGSIGAFLQPGAGQVLTLLDERSATALVTFDPNIRPALLGDGADARQQFLRIASIADVVKLSDEDAEWLYPDEALDAVLEAVLHLGPALVVVTRGHRGAILATRDGLVEVPTLAGTVVDTIGAGDTFMAGLLHCLAEMLAAGVDLGDLRDASALDENALERIGEFASACAAVTVGRVGADLPSLADLDQASRA